MLVLHFLLLSLDIGVVNIAIVDNVIVYEKLTFAENRTLVVCRQLFTIFKLVIFQYFIQRIHIYLAVLVDTSLICF